MTKFYWFRLLSINTTFLLYVLSRHPFKEIHFILNGLYTYTYINTIYITIYVPTIEFRLICYLYYNFFFLTIKQCFIFIHWIKELIWNWILLQKDWHKFSDKFLFNYNVQSRDKKKKKILNTFNKIYVYIFVHKNNYEEKIRSMRAQFNPTMT